MKKNFKHKEILIASFLYIITFLIIFLILTNKTNIFASKIDFDSQHYLLPEYFRNLFYNTHDLLPDFSLNLGAGMNIFYLSYYGLLSPIILLSYLMPDVPMIYYVIISSCLLAIISSILLFIYLRKRYNFIASLLGGFLFLMASPVIFHSHRHIMFVNYFIFLILGLFGIDKYVQKKQIWLLTLSIFLLIMTSYYYSVGGLLTLFIISLYEIYNANKKLKWHDILSLMVPFILGVMLGAIIILPTIYVIFNSRTGTGTNITFLSLLIPELNFKYILYSPYGPGCYLISLLATIYYLFKGDKPTKIISLFILLIGLFPIFNYILNGTLYVDSKSLIPMLPLIIILTTRFINDITINKVDYSFVIKIIIDVLILALIELIIDYFFNYPRLGLLDILDTFGYTGLLIIEAFVFLIIWFFNYNSRNKKGLLTYLFISAFFICLLINITDPLMSNKLFHKENKEINAYKLLYTKDKGFYRINNSLHYPSSFNKVIDLKQYQTSIYSSTNNKNYSYLYYEIFKNNISHRNRAMTPSSSNPLYNNLMAEKYIISQDYLEQPIVYEDYRYNIYYNDDYFPFGFVNHKIINENDFNKLNYPSQELNTLNAVISNTMATNTSILTVNESKFDYKIIESNNLKIYKENNKEKIISNKGYMIIKLNNVGNNGIIFLDFKNYNNPSCASPDLMININNQKNKLTCANWKYHNRNYIFHYTLNSNILMIKFDEGEYLLGDFHLYYLPYENYNYLNHDVDAFKPKKIKGDIISGTVNAKSNGYFVMQIPYDKGFNIKLDNKKIDYENVDNGLIGFKINKGHHKIDIEYHAPYKTLGIIINLIGLIIFIVIILKKDYNLFRKKEFKWKRLLKMKH